MNDVWVGVGIAAAVYGIGLVVNWYVMSLMLLLSEDYRGIEVRDYLWAWLLWPRTLWTLAWEVTIGPVQWMQVKLEYEREQKRALGAAVQHIFKEIVNDETDVE